MQLDKEQYKKLYKKEMPRSKAVRDCVIAFGVGGFICVIGQALLTLYGSIEGIDKDAAALLTSATLIALAAFLTGIGWYDNIARHAGAGTLVPITGFANSVVSPALEFKSEGLVLGTGAKMFIIAGPVIVYGTAASVIAGIVMLMLK